jgi:hypothetical protein
VINFLKKLLGGIEPKLGDTTKPKVGNGNRNRVQCTRCRTDMMIVSGMMMPTKFMQYAKGCFRCSACGAYECFECSDNRRPCLCGSRTWQEQLYISANEMSRVLPNAEAFEAPYVRTSAGPLRGLRNPPPRS